MTVEISAPARYLNSGRAQVTGVTDNEDRAYSARQNLVRVRTIEESPKQ